MYYVIILVMLSFYRYNDLRDIADYLYSYNPCYDYTEGLCSNVHVSGLIFVVLNCIEDCLLLCLGLPKE